MLKEVTIKNFKSINNELTFSMEADCERVSEYEDSHIIDINGSKLLKVTSMYGPNGGGKTNLLLAIQLAKNVLLGEQYLPTNERSLSCEFNIDDIISETIFFVTKKYELGFHFEVKYNLKEQETIDFTGNKMIFNYPSFDIVSESVVYKEFGSNDFKVLYERDIEGKIESQMLDELNINYSKVINSNMTALKYLYGTFVNVIDVKYKVFDIILNLYQEIINIHNLEITSVNYNVAFNIINANKEKLVNLLNDVDIKINDIIIDKNDKISPIRFERIVNINDRNEKRSISLNDESKGTKKIFWMFVNLLSEHSRSHIYLCDDMNAYLHPKLFKAIIELFNSNENIDKQLIFNSHDIINMNNELFRRDEIWFVYRDDNYSTIAIPLSNIVNSKGEQIRKDAKYYKQYLEGRYGADPFIKKGLSWNE